ncbi:MAG: glycosyltransferase [Chloroflexota bacterium]|nr:glycosyltransferase [Chloroflexota bacterium]
MINILGFTRGTDWDELDGPQYYRCYLPLREVNRSAEGIEAQVMGHETIAGLSDDELGGRDVYVMARMYHSDCKPFVDEIHRQGGVLVLDTDDDLTECHKLVSGRGPEFIEVLGEVDYVTCSTPALAAHIGQFTQKPPTVLRNCVDTEWMTELAGKSKRIAEGLTVGFTGSPTHWGDWRVAAVPLAQIVREFDHVTPLLHGEVPRYLKYVAPEERLISLGGVPMAVYPVLLHQFDVVLCAVDVNDGFNIGKSAVKALECMALGIVPICSRFTPYMELAEAGAPVVIVEDDTPSAWYDAMATLVTDDGLRESLANRGLDWVRANRDMRLGGYEQWATFYRSICV